MTSTPTLKAGQKEALKKISNTLADLLKAPSSTRAAAKKKPPTLAEANILVSSLLGTEIDLGHVGSPEPTGEEARAPARAEAPAIALALAERAQDVPAGSGSANEEDPEGQQDDPEQPSADDDEEVHSKVPGSKGKLLISAPTKVQKSPDLLSLRKQLKRETSTQNKLESHLSFLKKCSEKSLTPQGLKVSIKCHAFMKKETTIEDTFQQLTEQLEKQLGNALIAHYEALLEEQEEVVQETHGLIDEAYDRAKQTTQREHDRIMSSMMNNLDKHTAQLEKTKNSKFRKLEDPDRQPRKYRTDGTRGKQGNSRPRRDGRTPSDKKQRSRRDAPSTRRPAPSSRSSSRQSNKADPPRKKAPHRPKQKAKPRRVHYEEPERKTRRRRPHRRRSEYATTATETAYSDSDTCSCTLSSSPSSSEEERLTYAQATRGFRKHRRHPHEHEGDASERRRHHSSGSRPANRRR